MRFGNRTIGLDRGMSAQRCAGTMLALLALFCQLVISVLPMPAMAEGQFSALDPTICLQTDDGSQTPAKPGKATGHAGIDCPVCQAALLLGSLVPPAPLDFQPTFGQARDIEFPATTSIRPVRFAAGHRARAPPPSV